MLPPEGLPSAVWPCQADALLEALDRTPGSVCAVVQVAHVLQHVVLGPDQLVGLGQVGRAAVRMTSRATQATSGLPETPEKASDPPHCRPSFNSATGCGVRRAAPDLRQPLAHERRAEVEVGVEAIRAG